MFMLERAAVSPAASDERPTQLGIAVRRGTAVMEFAVCLPVLLFLLFGVWEVGRMVEVNQVMWGAAREGGRQCSTCTSDLNTVAQNVLTYLLNAEPTALIVTGHTPYYTPGNSTNPSYPGAKVVVATLDTPTGTVIYSFFFQNLTTPSKNDPTTCSQLDKFMVAVTIPYKNIRWVSSPMFTDANTELRAQVYWYSLIDTPIVINQLPVQ